MKDLLRDKAEIDAIEASLAGIAEAASRHISRDATKAGRDAFHAELNRFTLPRQRLDRMSIRLMHKLTALPQQTAASTAAALDRGEAAPPGPLEVHRLRAGIASVRARLALWGPLSGVIDRVLSLDSRRRDRPIPLLPPFPGPAGELLAAHSGPMNTLYIALHRLVSNAGQAPEAVENHAYRDIPLPLPEFVALCHAALRIAMAQERPAPLRFIDIGCGSGTKVLAASCLFHVADGLEYDSGHVACGRDFISRLGNSRCRILDGDGMTFPDYAGYDVIYFYKPIDNPPMMTAMERNIVATARPGTILIAPYPDFWDRAEHLDIGLVARSIYVTGLTDRAAGTLRKRAERIGTRIPPADLAHDRKRLGYLFPLVQACRRVGYDLP